MIQGTRHVGIVVGDMERALRFWRDIMGLEPVADFWEEGEFIDAVENLQGVKLHMIKLRAPDGMLVELLQDHHHPTSPPSNNDLCDRGIRHIAFTVADVDNAWVTLRREGCEVLSKPVTAPDGKARIFFARDPEGNLIEMVQPLA